ncbi:MAG: nucleotidyltransferase family protein [Candidatus Marinimicrobia bacterium]|nr:nucleotidyltransferase family protein [Candidatus Neomarinimicrobiota bacterium]
MSVCGVILAAGYSSRVGDFKPALNIFGKSILQRSIESMSDLCGQVIVVGGHEIEKIIEIVGDISKVKIVKNEHVELGMFSSVRVGVAHVNADRFFVLPGDQPVVRKSTFETLLEKGGDIIIPRFKGKKGHPVLFSAHCISEILALPDTAILRNYIHSKKDVKILDVDDPGIGMDVDTSEDYEIIKEYYKQHFIKY